MEQWHLVYTKRHQETPVNRLLQKKGWETFLPGMEIERGYGRGRRLDPFFPQYIFIYVDLASTQAQELRFMTGVSKIVEFGGAPLIVPASVVDEIRSRHDEYVALKTGVGDMGGVVANSESAPRTVELDSLFAAGLSGKERSELLLYLLLK